MKPIPSVGVLIIENGKVLLVREEEGSSHLTGVYGVPAGRFEEGEDARHAAARELNEETGLSCLPEDLVAMPGKYTATIPRKDGTIKTFMKTLFLCRKYSGEISPQKDTTPFWIEIDRIEGLDLLPNVDKMVKDGLKFASS